MTDITIARTAGRITGTAFAQTRRLARQIDWQEVGQIVLHGIVTLAVMTYLAGEFTGRALHHLNNQLAGLWRRLWVPELEVLAEPAAELIPQPTVKESPTLTVLAWAAENREQCAKRLRRQGWTQQRIADHFLVSRSTVRRLLTA